MNELLAAVYANPADTAARLVYADALSDAGDPRGEFIALQCHGRDEARQRDLLEAHRDEWLGKLATVVDPALTEFERGFATSVRIKRVPRPQLTKLVGNPAWATVERLDFDEHVGGGVVKHGAVIRGTRVPAAAIVLSPVMRSLRELSGIDGDVLVTLCSEGDALPIVGARASTYPLLVRDANEQWQFDDAARGALEHARGLPRLRRLTLHGYPSDRPDLSWLLGSPLAGRLERLALENFGGELDHWMVLARTAHRQLGELAISYWSDRDVIRFHRGTTGLLDRVVVDLRRLSQFQRGGIAAALDRVAPELRKTVELVR